MQPPKKDNLRLRRRWWQRLLRISTTILLVLAAAYITLPRWVPVDWLRSYLERDLARQAGANVHIHAMSLSWARGVEILGLSIDSPAPHAPETMLRVDGIRLDLAPLDLLLRNRIAWMEVDRPRLSVRWDANGNCNLGSLARLTDGPETARISVRQADVMVYPTEEGSVPLHVRVADVQLVGGAVDEIGHVTVSAALDQRGGSAPVGVNVQGNVGEDGVKAAATFNFANVKLEQLHLVQLLNLPLKTLSGTCRGAIKFRMSRSGVIDQFAVQVDIQNLDVQPAEGPHIPVIEQAGLNMQASIDLIENRLQIQQAAVRLPGVELTGSGAMSTDIIAGQWRAIDSLQLAGEVYPDRLAALLTNQPALPGGFGFTGPIRIDGLQIHQANQVLDLALTASATAAAIRQDKRILKPAGRELELQLAGQLDFRTWALSIAKNTRLSLGQNRFAFSGQLDDLRQLAELAATTQPSASQPARSPMKKLLAAVSRFEGRGSWEIADLNSLCDLHPELALALRDANFRGSLEGQWSIDRRTRTRLDANMNIPAATVLRIPGVFAKGEDQAFGATFACTLDANAGGVKDVALDVSTGLARLSVSAGQLVQENGNAGNMVGHAQFEVTGAESLTLCLPMLEGLRGKMRGTVKGEAAANVTAGLSTASLSADLKNLGIDWPGAVTKPPGRAADVKLSITHKPGEALNERLQASVLWQTPEVELVARATTADNLDQAVRVGKGACEVHIHDVNWLTGTFPGLNRFVKDSSLTGSLQLTAQGTWEGPTLSGQVRVNADAVDVIADSPVRIHKMNVPLNLLVDGRLERRPDGGLSAELGSLVLNVANCTARLSGQATVEASPVGDNPKAPANPAAAPTPAFRLRALQLQCDTTFNVDQSLSRLLPDVEYWIDRLKMSGQIHVANHLALDGNEYHLTSLTKADELAATIPLAVFTGMPTSASQPTAENDQLLKPCGLPATVKLDAIVADDFSRVLVQNVIVTAGELNVLASMLAENKARSSDTNDWIASAHLAVGTRKVQNLACIWPGLTQYAPTGEWALDTEWKMDANGQRLSYATLQLADLHGIYNHKDVFLNGDVTLRNIPLMAARVQPQTQPSSQPVVAWQPPMDGVKIDRMEFRIGKNHAWVLADLNGLAAAPKGEFHVVGEYLDDKDIADWLIDGNAARPATAPLDANAKLALQKRTAAVLDVFRHTLADANMHGRISVERMRTFDKEVKEYYDVSSLEAIVSLERGQVSLSAEASLNGGIYSQSACTNFNDPNATLITLADIHNVAATKNIQPQIAAYFPGNNVFGTFGRKAKLITPLRDVAANMLDERWKVISLGEATTLAMDGEVEGQSTPSYATRLFPDLNLAKFHYRRMTGFARNRADGSVENQMIFNGSTYHIYMEGTTTADNVCEYQIGLVLLGGIVSPEVHRDWKQGRVPLLKFKGKIVNGSFEDEKISLLWPHESAFEVFVKNNPFYRLWLNTQKK